MYVFFIDLKAAFDSVDHPILFERLRQHGINAEVINTVKYIYSNVHTQVDISTPQIPINKGVLQGGILSPILFNIYINDMIEDLLNTGAADVSAYADDIAITCVGRESLETAIRVTRAWCDTNKIAMNNSKSGILVVKKRVHK